MSKPCPEISGLNNSLNVNKWSFSNPCLVISFKTWTKIILWKSVIFFQHSSVKSLVNFTLNFPFDAYKTPTRLRELFHHTRYCTLGRYFCFSCISGWVPVQKVPVLKIPKQLGYFFSTSKLWGKTCKRVHCRMVKEIACFRNCSLQKKSYKTIYFSKYY